MLKVSISDGGGERVLSITGRAVIGRGTVCEVVLSDPGASRKNSEICNLDGSYVLRDLRSTNGTFLNGERCNPDKNYPLRQGDLIRIGGGTISILSSVPVGPHPGDPAVSPETPGSGAPAPLREEVHRRLIRYMDLRHLSLEDPEGVRGDARRALQDILDEMAPALPPTLDIPAFIDEILNEALGLGPIEAYLEDPSVTEIMVNGTEGIYVEVGGKLRRTERKFSSERAILRTIERIVSPLGRRIDEASPMVDARLRDGSRVNAVIPPLSLSGPVVTIRKFSRSALTIDDIVAWGSLTRQMADFLRIAVATRKNIVISGGTGSGKTTLLNVLASFIPADERIITIEDAAELRLPQDHVVSLEARPANIEDKGAVTIRDLVRNALRMRPDRIVVGECRGGEALDMLQAMNTGHDGSLTTAHANSPRDLLSRLETMVLMSGMDLPVRAIRDQIRGAVDLIVHQSRFKDGTRKIVCITEVQGMEGDIITLQDVFLYRQSGTGPGGVVLGEFRPTGFVPRFVETLRTMGVTVPQEIFA